jgi:arsenate reductase-like glutaredoxin family protein
MNIQIFGKKKCFDTKKAERYFKERRIKVQRIDLMSKGISSGELQSIIKSVGFDNLVNEKSSFYEESLIPYTSDMERKKEILEEYPEVLHTPIVRNGKQATIGFKPEIWKTWE